MSTTAKKSTGTPEKAKVQTVKDLLKSEVMQTQIKRALPRHISVDKFVRAAFTATTRNPKLHECTVDSFAQCLFELAELGLFPDSRKAHLVPFKDNKKGMVLCQKIIDYKGFAELVRNSGDVKDIYPGVVCENDEFDFEYGTNRFLRHKWSIFEDRGEVLAFYSYVVHKSGEHSFDIMSKGEVEQVREYSKAKNDGPWVTHFVEMGKKTVFRRHAKWLDLSPEAQRLIDADDEQFEFNSKPARGQISEQATFTGGDRKQLEASGAEVLTLGGNDTSEPEPSPDPAAKKAPTKKAAAKKESEPEPKSEPTDQKQELVDRLYQEGISFDQVMEFASGSDALPEDPSSYGSIHDLPDVTIKHLLAYWKHLVEYVKSSEKA